MLNAVGALCLNQIGQDQLAARPSIIPGLMSIFTSEKHIKVLQDKENAASIGGSLDELIRHHPTLKTSVFESLVSILAVIESLSNQFTPSEDVLHWYLLSPYTSSFSTTDGDITMSDSSVSSILQETRVLQPSPAIRDDLGAHEEEVLNKAPENIVVSYMNATCKVCYFY